MKTCLCQPDVCYKETLAQGWVCAKSVAPAAGSAAGCEYYRVANECCTLSATTAVRYPPNKRWMPVCSTHANVCKSFGWEEKPQNEKLTDGADRNA